MTQVKSANHVKYETLLNAALNKAYAIFEKDMAIQSQLNSLNTDIANALGISINEYRKQELYRLFNEAAVRANKDYKDFGLEMVLTPSEIEEIKRLETLVYEELI